MAFRIFAGNNRLMNRPTTTPRCTLLLAALFALLAALSPATAQTTGTQPHAVSPNAEDAPFRLTDVPPTFQGGEPVRVKYSLPILFRLQVTNPVKEKEKTVRPSKVPKRQLKRPATTK